MALLKYFEKIQIAQATTRAAPPGPLDPFDLSPLIGKSRLKQRMARLVFRKGMPAIFAILREVWPNPRFGRLVIATRDADVRQVLKNPSIFEVPFALEMTELAGGTNSVLGLEGEAHKRLNHAIAEVLRHDDLPRLEEWSRGYAQSLVDASGGTIDVVTDLITRVATEVCCRYFGIATSDPNAFAQWTIAVSNLLFADPTGSGEARRIGLNGAARIRAVLEDSVARSHEKLERYPNAPEADLTIIDRLIRQGVMTDAEIIATIMGLASGFIPTNTLAAGNMLEELLARPALMKEARAAAAAGDTKELRLALLEAARRNPALSPGQWRTVVQAGVIAEGRGGERRVKPGDLVLVAIGSALRDKDRPATDSKDPEAATELLFGYGRHACLGRYVAMTQIAEVFRVLLAQPGLEVDRGSHGWMQRMGVFPIRLDMTFAASNGTQSMIIVSAPVLDGAGRRAIEQKIEALGNPGSPAVRACLDATGIIHFASMAVIEAARDSDDSIVLVELNADGPRDAALDLIARHCLAWLGPIMQHCAPPGSDELDAPALAALLKARALDLHCRPWGPIGVHYNGTAEFAVRDIARQQRLAAFARNALTHFFEQNLGTRVRPMEALTRVRRLARQDSYYKLKSSWSKLRAEAAEFEFSLVRPSRKRLALAEWQPPASRWAPLGLLAKSHDGQALIAGFAVAWGLAVIGLVHLLQVPLAGPRLGMVLDGITLALVSVIGGFFGTVVLAMLAISALALILYLHEIRDPVDDRPPDLAKMKALAAREDEPGYEQNHIIAVMPLKPGLFRKLVFAFALWGIKQSVTYWFRPGFVVTMGTIHYAKWFRVPGTQQFVFLSNYDGNWESYLEDFVTRAHWGQTAAWSNGVGFPRTRLLILDGARDGDRFKRWVRRQQRVTPFWYSRFPDLTTRQIRNNAVIEDGLANGVSDSDARTWLACFGSAQREAHEMETSEVQSIVFSGFGSLHHATCIALRLPTTPTNQVDWLTALTGARIESPQMMIAAAFDGGLTEGSRLPSEFRIAFGDHPVTGGAAVLALSANGLAKLGLGNADGRGGLGDFPAAFNFGMAGRGRVLGDRGAAGPDNWLWSDAPDGDGKATGADAVLIAYGGYGRADEKDPAGAHKRLVDTHLALLAHFGGEALHLVPTGPLLERGRPTLEKEHFGFRDGISQPVIRGTQRASEEVPSRDLVEPGEFLLGYRNNQGYYPPLISVPEESDRRNDLPILNEGPPGRFPKFGSAPTGTRARDFGRNGTFLVIRELDQHVGKFNAAMQHHARDLSARYPGLSAVAGHRINADWVAAKLVGRWKDGTPLVGNVTRPKGRSRRKPQNDFAYGTDDPRGYQCPLGAHIRRANPRDSLEPGDNSEQFITNRHRLLRRGRSYEYGTGEDGLPRKGLLFMALCADLERQFEFVQHTWVNASSFHGLADEPDPITGHEARNADFQPRPRNFTIPTPVGPVVVRNLSEYVSMRGGGYFFVPSYAALKYLCTLVSRNAKAERPRVAATAGTDDGAASPATTEQRVEVPAK